MSATGSERLFWAEVQSDDCTRRSVAVCYALLMATERDAADEFWFVIHQAIIDRFKMKSEAEIVRFQIKAKTIYMNASNIIVPDLSDKKVVKNVEPAG